MIAAVSELIFGEWWFGSGERGNGDRQKADEAGNTAHVSSPDDSYSIREPSDDVLVAATRAGDSVAFETLVRRYHGRLVAAAEAALGRQAEAEDVVQDVLLRVWVNRASWEPTHGAAAYFFGAVANRVRNAWRNRSRTTEMLNRASREQANITEQPVDDLADVWEVMAQLPERWRTAIILRYVRDSAFSDVGRAMGISENAAKKLVRRAMLALTDALAEK
jgi:RNA polymerase sigma-70 factor (ECF subfamily)